MRKMKEAMFSLFDDIKFFRTGEKEKKILEGQEGTGFNTKETAVYLKLPRR